MVNELRSHGGESGIDVKLGVMLALWRGMLSWMWWRYSYGTMVWYDKFCYETALVRLCGAGLCCWGCDVVVVRRRHRTSHSSLGYIFTTRGHKGAAGESQPRDGKQNKKKSKKSNRLIPFFYITGEAGVITCNYRIVTCSLSKGWK